MAPKDQVVSPPQELKTSISTSSKEKKPKAAGGSKKKPKKRVPSNKSNKKTKKNKKNRKKKAPAKPNDSHKEEVALESLNMEEFYEDSEDVQYIVALVRKIVFIEQDLEDFYKNLQSK